MVENRHRVVADAEENVCEVGRGHHELEVGPEVVADAAPICGQEGDASSRVGSRVAAVLPRVLGELDERLAHRDLQERCLAGTEADGRFTRGHRAAELLEVRVLLVLRLERERLGVVKRARD